MNVTWNTSFQHHWPLRLRSANYIIFHFMCLRDGHHIWLALLHCVNTVSIASYSCVLTHLKAFLFLNIQACKNISYPPHSLRLASGLDVDLCVKNLVKMMCWHCRVLGSYLMILSPWKHWYMNVEWVSGCPSESCGRCQSTHGLSLWWKRYLSQAEYLFHIIFFVTLTLQSFEILSIHRVNGARPWSVITFVAR